MKNKLNISPGLFSHFLVVGTVFFTLTLMLGSCKELLEGSELKGRHVYVGGETKVKIGSWSTEEVGNGRIEIDFDAGSFKFTAGSVNTKTELEISFGTGFSNETPRVYQFETLNPSAFGDYWRETSSDIYIYSQEWGTGLPGRLEITNLTEDIIEGEYEFDGKDYLEDSKIRTVKGSFSIPKE